MITAADLRMLRRCVELAEQALDAGDEPFGSLITSASGQVLAEDRNRVGGGDPTRHPELALARWAAEHLTVEERGQATVYTSGEHCPMCSAAHAWVGLGRIVYASSAEQLARWTAELGGKPTPVRPLPIRQIAPHLRVDGPVPELAELVHELHRRSAHESS